MKLSDIERRFSAGECILDRDACVAELYVIRAGQVRLVPDGRLLGPGDVFGEVAAITGRPSRERAVAESEGALLSIDVDLLQELCLENGEFAVRLIRHLAERLGGSARAQIVPGPSAAEVAASVARAILSRADFGDTPAPVRGRLRELAGEAGLDLLATYHEIQSLLEEKVVRLAEDHLQILDREALESMSAPAG
jgi:CRP-like cAMP-binding protein